MFKALEFLFHTLPLIFAWLYLLVAIFALIVHIKQVVIKNRLSFISWAFAIFNLVYLLLFSILRIFFQDTWSMLFSIVGLCAIIISTCLTCYEDKLSGRKWWNW